MSPALKEQIIKMIEWLPDESLDKLLTLISQMKDKTETAAGAGRFSGLSGSISREDAAIMRRAIEEREKSLAYRDTAPSRSRLGFAPKCASPHT